MLLSIEKIIILSSIEMFSEIPVEVLHEVSAALEEEEVAAGEKIINKGDFGTCMYIIVTGKVRVHDEDKELAVLGDRDVFGEISALDPELSSTSVTAVEDTLLLKLEYESLLELISSSLVLARDIIRFLCRRYRTKLIKGS